MPTNKVKITCPDESNRNKLLRTKYIKLGGNNKKYRVVEYNAPRPITQCLKCQEFHNVNKCPLSDFTCKLCSGSHYYKACNTPTRKCANCQENHPATFKGCPAYKEAKAKNDSIKMINKAAALKPADTTEMTRLASTLICCFRDLAFNADVDMVSKITTHINTFYKTSINPISFEELNHMDLHKSKSGSEECIQSIDNQL